MVSIEDLVLLQRETKTLKGREKIFLKIYEAVEKEAFEICHYYKKLLNHLADKDSFFEDAMQESRLCLLKCIDKFDINKNTKFTTFYRKCLMNHLSIFYKEVSSVGKNEIIDSTIFNWTNGEGGNENNITDEIDNKELYKFLRENIDDLPFAKPIHKDILNDYLGFTDRKTHRGSFADTGQFFNISRMTVKKIVDKYLSLLRTRLTENGRINKVQEYLT